MVRWVGRSVNNGFCTFSRWRTKPEVVIGRHLEHSHSHRLIQPNKSEVSITVILSQKTKFTTTSNSKKVSTNTCDIDGQPEIAMWPSKPEVLISPTVWQISLQFRRQTWVFDKVELAESVRNWLQHRTTTENSDMAAKTGNSYTTGTTTSKFQR